MQKNIFVTVALSISWLTGFATVDMASEQKPEPSVVETHFLKDAPDADGMFTALFYIQPDFLSLSDAPRDPDELRKRTTAKGVLIEHGVKFGVNATATFFPATSILSVHNTKDELQKCAVFVSSLIKEPPMILRFRWRVVEIGEASWIEFTSRQNDKLPRSLSSEDLKKLQSDSTWRSRALAEQETRSGQIAKIESGTDMQIISGFKAEGEHLVPEIEKQKTGFNVEVDPVLCPDDKTVDVNFSLSYDYAPPDIAKVDVVAKTKNLPQQHVDLVTWHRDMISTAITVIAGDTVVVGVNPVVVNAPAAKSDEPRLRLYLLTVTRHFIGSK